ncbi:MAG: hypothetical protein Q9163_000769 [Psora crenata]
MANRQTSFFDQKRKPRQSRHKNWIPSNARCDPECVSKLMTARTPIAASSQSKSRLKAYQFYQEKVPVKQHGSPGGNANKENAGPAANQKSSPGINSPPLRLSQTSATKPLRDWPQTPVGRLPLTELLSNGDDMRPNLASTPVERVLWDNSPLSSNFTTSQPAKKRRRRAHSTSPLSSSQNEASEHFTCRKQAKDPQALQQVLKTPKVDPANDLWSRYSLNTDKLSPSAPGILPLSHLIHSSSPQTPAGHLQSRDGRLRRSFSCIEWHTSAAKRRKMHQNCGQAEATAEATAYFVRPLEAAEKPSMSRVSLLVDKIHSDLSKPRKIQGYPSSGPFKSPPAIPRNELYIEGAYSSQYSNVAANRVVTGRNQKVVTIKTPQPEEVLLSEDDLLDLAKAAASSDFGDDELDIDMVDIIDKTRKGGTRGMDTVPEEPPSRNETDDDKVLRKGTAGKPPLTNSIYHLTKRQASPNRLLGNTTSGAIPQPFQQACSDRDEFDEDSADVSAADLEGVFAQYDTHTPVRTITSDKYYELREASKCKNTGPALTQEVGVIKQAMMSRTETLSSDGEEFEDDFDFEQITAECAETSKEQNLEPPLESIVLSVECERTQLSKVITLRQAWLDTPCTPGSYVQLVGEFDRYSQCIIDNNQNLLILHPDHLISSTVVGDSFTCIRKAVLQDQVKVKSDINQATVYGQILHEIFQETMRENKWDDAFISTTIEIIIIRHLEALFEINIDPQMAVEQLKARAEYLQAWADIFVGAKPKPNAVITDRNGAQALMSINKLLEVEEHVWSPTYGLKGNIDATVQIELKADDYTKTLTVPFELKTGKHASAAHKAQTSLYSLLLSDRYGVPRILSHKRAVRLTIWLDINIACGILYYMQTSAVSSVRTLRHELVPLIIQRNAIASFVRMRTILPPMLKKPYTCGKCYSQTPCFIYHRLVDDGNGQTSGMGEKFDNVIKHLQPGDQEFFRKWDDLLTKEEKDIVKFRRELWTMQSEERERVGRCFGGLVIQPGSFREEEDAPKINRFHYTFVKQTHVVGFSFTESQITVGEPIVVSDENGHFALANGYVTKVRKHDVQVTLDRRLHNARARKGDFDPENNQVFLGIMQVVPERGRSRSQSPRPLDGPLLYRLDKDEFSNGMALVRNNLIRLMEKDLFGVQALRRLIVEGVPPTFKPIASAYNLGDGASRATLNVDQKAAIEKVMSANHYALVLGMPGTGKTTTIAQIIRALVAEGKSVLLTSYTHTAVDNILLKLRHDGIGIFRLGAMSKIHPEVQGFADLAARPMRTIEELKACYARKVVATTCLGINHPIFNQRIFDYCIVDEASQITLPVCLGPIRMARTFILVGDHYQLPPLVQNKDALEGGLDISLFKMLSDKHPSSVVNLEHQYRMCEDVMTLSNTLIYGGRLKCGTKDVATRSILIPNLAALKQHHHTSKTILLAESNMICPGPSRGTCWIRDLIDPSIKACFVDTDPLLPRSREVLESGSRITNPCEATLASQLVDSLVTTGVALNEIGVITLYRSQLALLKESLHHRPGVEMHTADKFQGRDKEVVILSLVRSNEKQIVGDLLKDWRRVNVALTRARTKLLILGSKDTLISNKLLKSLIALMEGKGWSYNLPAEACKGHIFQDAEAQLSGKGSAGLKSKPAPTTAPTKWLDDAMGGSKGSRKNKVPTKQGKFDLKAIIGKRPVLRDIINDVS